MWLHGSYGLVISDGKPPLLQNDGKLYNYSCKSSFLSELYAILSGVLTLQLLSKDYAELKGTKRAIKLISDYKSLVKMVNHRLPNKRKT
jgi:hypothetical protein